MTKTLKLLLIVSTVIVAGCASSPEPAKPLGFMIDTVNLKFQPALIDVTAGQPVELTLNNQDAVEHDFSIKEIPMASTPSSQEPASGHDMSGMAGEPELHLAAAEGQSATLEFTPTEPGIYEFFCTVPGHKEAGMTGMLKVKSS